MKFWSELQQPKSRTLEIYSGVELPIAPPAGEQVQNETDKAVLGWVTYETEPQKSFI